MDNIRFFITSFGEEFVEIDRGNDEFTSMTKAHYEEQYGPIGEVNN